VITLDLATANPVVLVIDMQVAFVSPDGAFGNDAGPLIERLNVFLDGCRTRSVPVVFSSYLLREDLADAGLLREDPAARHFSDAAPGAPADPRVHRADRDIDVRHNRPSAFFRSDLEAVLRGLRADAVILTGVSVNNAISSTARDAFARDIPPLVVRDCVGGTPWEPEEKHETYFDILAMWTAEVADSENVLGRLDAGSAQTM
jgi:bifunctional isochorismate lyase/aryl carrier protein